MLDRKLQRVPGQRERLLRPALTVGNIGLADESVREQAREPVRLGDRQGGLHTFFGEVELAAEEVEAAELSREDGEVLVRLVFGEHLVRPLHPRQPFVEPAGLPIDLGQSRGHAGGRVSLAGLLEQVEGTPVAILRLGLARAGQGHFARAFEQTRLVQRVVGELGGLLEVALGLLCGGE